MKKSDQGKSLKSGEMEELLIIRKAANIGIADPMTDVRTMIGQLKEAANSLNIARRGK